MRWLILLSLTTATASADPVFRPFSDVPDVCPSCTTGPQWDQVTTKDGRVLRAHVVADDGDFFVLERFGELRALGKGQVAKVDHAKTPDPVAAYPDAILFSDGIVLAGSLKDDASGDPLEIVVPPANLTHAAPKAAVQAIYRQGKSVYSAPAK